MIWNFIIVYENGRVSMRVFSVGEEQLDLSDLLWFDLEMEPKAFFLSSLWKSISGLQRCKGGERM
jgi:hypothetical protein